MTIQSKIYRFENDVWVLKQTTGELSYNINIQGNLSNYGTLQIWRIDTYDTESELTIEGDIWSFRVQPFLIITNPDFDENDYRYSDYEPDKTWQFVDGEYSWVDIADTTGGGRWHNNMAIISIDENGKGKINYV